MPVITQRTMYMQQHHTAPRGRYIPFFDIAKVLCIVLVVIGHYIPDDSPAWWIWLHNVIYTFHMPLFLFVSGAIYAVGLKAGESYAAFVRKKALRLMVPYLTASVLIICVKLLTQGSLAVEHPTTPLSFVRMLYYPEAGFFLWFIWALWWMFLIVRLFVTRGSRLVLLVVAAVLACFDIDIDVLCISQLCKMFVYFMLGVVVFDNEAMRQVSRRAALCGFVVSAVAFVGCIALFGDDGRVGDFMPVAVATAMSGTVAMLSLAKIIDGSMVSRRLLLPMASSTYIIYLLHTTFMGFAKVVTAKLSLTAAQGELAFVAGAAAVVVAGVVLPVIVHRVLLRRYAVLRVLFGIN